MDRTDSIERIISAIQHIEKLHDQLLISLAEGDSSQAKSGVLNAVNRIISIELLGHKIECANKPIIIDAEKANVAYEYIFRCFFQDQVTKVFSMYLDTDGILSDALIGGRQIVNHRNKYIPSKVLDVVLSGLLKSNIFSSSK